MSAYYESDIGLGSGETTITILVLTTTTVKTIVANVYWAFTVYRGSCQDFFVVSFNPPPHTHMADTIIIPTVKRKKDAKPLLWTLM